VAWFSSSASSPSPARPRRSRSRPRAVKSRDFTVPAGISERGRDVLDRRALDFVVEQHHVALLLGEREDLLAHERRGLRRLRERGRGRRDGPARPRVLGQLGRRARPPLAAARPAGGSSGSRRGRCTAPSRPEVRLERDRERLLAELLGVVPVAAQVEGGPVEPRPRARAPTPRPARRPRSVRRRPMRPSWRLSARGGRWVRAFSARGRRAARLLHLADGGDEEVVVERLKR